MGAVSFLPRPPGRGRAARLALFIPRKALTLTPSRTGRGTRTRKHRKCLHSLASFGNFSLPGSVLRRPSGQPLGHATRLASFGNFLFRKEDPAVDGALFLSCLAPRCRPPSLVPRHTWRGWRSAPG